ncbi:MAG: ADP-glyceromanno-heptose 6-epimerase [Candidatus Cloacimonetes bacterium]|nr:ADP-glyceromanno-heptose 6-epimerase [Candidatus Cloacimonadota bacterium]
MFVVTGGAGFIGSALVAKLNDEGIQDIIIVDDLGTGDKWKNLVNLQFSDYIHKDTFLRMVMDNIFKYPIDAMFHMGACSSTTERNAEYLLENNYKYSKELAEWAIKNDTWFCYASSGATYGDGSLGFSDDPEMTMQIHPTNMYGYSKQLMDLWATRTEALKLLTGLKFFNVYGPNEYHKGSMRSMVIKAYNQVMETGKIKLFKSNHSDWKDGNQQRDFIYVKDVVDTMWYLLNNPEIKGLYNLGTGIARTWNDLAKAVFAALDKPASIEYIDMPADLHEHYQNFTQAEMDALEKSGCPCKFTSLEDGVKNYIQEYLLTNNKYL